MRCAKTYGIAGRTQGGNAGAGGRAGETGPGLDRAGSTLPCGAGANALPIVPQPGGAPSAQPGPSGLHQLKCTHTIAFPRSSRECVSNRDDWGELCLIF